VFLNPLSNIFFFGALNRSLFLSSMGGMHKDDNILLLGKISQNTLKSGKESLSPDKEHERTIGGRMAKSLDHPYQEVGSG